MSIRQPACLALVLSLVSCTKAAAPTGSNATGNTSPGNTGTVPATAAATSSEPSDQTVAIGEPSLVSLSAGAFPVKRATEWSGNFSAVQLLDENATSTWTSADGHVEPQALTIALPEKTVLKTLTFDCTISPGSPYAGSCAKDVAVEISDTGQNDGFRTLADVSLKEGANNQNFPVPVEVPGRWVRLTIRNNHGHERVLNLNDFRATGTELTHTPFPEITGTYDSDYGNFRIKQSGTSVSGCFDTRAGMFEGGIEGRVVKVNWCDDCDVPRVERGPALVIFAPDGAQFIGLWWNEGKTSEQAFQAGGKTKKSRDAGMCRQWASAADDMLTKELEEFGRARVYGINFESDSDRVKDESKPTLDKIAGMLKAKPDWNVLVEGHTDSTSTPQRNQDLSERRAASVKSYLQAAGVEAPRLKTAGYGSTRPVASNDTELGRAQNRRVELAKQ